MIPTKAKETFWDVVEECLEHFHHLPKPAAHERSRAFRTRLESLPPGIASDVIYHAEPFDIDCDITGHQLDLSAYSCQYDTILNRHNW